MNHKAAVTFDQSNHTKTLNMFLVWFITLCSLKFFTLFVPISLGKGLMLMAVVLSIVLLFLFLTYGTGSTIRLHFKTEVFMILASLIISAFAAAFFHEQPVGVTLFAQFAMYLFIFYFLIHQLAPDPDKLLKMFVWLGYIYCMIYFVQYLAYPAEIVTSPALKDRGTIRIIMPGTEYLIAAWFIQLSRYFITKRIIHIIGMIPFVIILILLGTRQVLAATALLTILYILQSKALKSKTGVFILIFISIVPFYFLFKDIFDQMLDVTSKSDDVRQNIRFMAAGYFMFELNHNPIWIFTGNGFPGPHSDYGKFLMRISEELGYYQSDVGIIGDFSKYGILFVIAQIMFVLKLSFYKHQEKYLFIRYSALMVLLTMFTGAGLGGAFIVFASLLFYMVDYQKHTKSIQSVNLVDHINNKSVA